MRSSLGGDETAVCNIYFAAIKAEKRSASCTTRVFVSKQPETKSTKSIRRYGKYKNRAQMRRVVREFARFRVGIMPEECQEQVQ